MPSTGKIRGDKILLSVVAIQLLVSLRVVLGNCVASGALQRDWEECSMAEIIVESAVLLRETAEVLEKVTLGVGDLIFTW